MTSRTVYPFRRPKDHRFHHEVWVYHRGDVEIVLADHVPDWDPMTDVYLRSEVTIDLGGICNDCDFDTGDRLRLLARWESTGTGLKGKGETVDILQLRGTKTLGVELCAPGPCLGESLIAWSELVLLEAQPPKPLACPSLPGSRLWAHSSEFRLEGAGTRFPVEFVDFSNSHVPSRAGWYLDWSPVDLHKPVYGAIRLLINMSNEKVAAAVSTVEPDEEAHAIWSAIALDVARSLVFGALTSSEYLSGPGLFEEDTLGRSLHRLLHMCFPEAGDNPESLATRLREDPEQLNAALQAALRVFNE